MEEAVVVLRAGDGLADLVGLQRHIEPDTHDEDRLSGRHLREDAGNLSAADQHVVRELDRGLDPGHFGNRLRDRTARDSEQKLLRLNRFEVVEAHRDAVAAEAVGPVHPGARDLARRAVPSRRPSPRAR